MKIRHPKKRHHHLLAAPPSSAPVRVLGSRHVHTLRVASVAGLAAPRPRGAAAGRVARRAAADLGAEPPSRGGFEPWQGVMTWWCLAAGAIWDQRPTWD